MGALGPHDGWMLTLFGAHVDQAFGDVPYHVGSSLTWAKGKAKYRDVDVRLILNDEWFAQFFDERYSLPMWNLAWSALGQKMTGLPIDFQFQQQTAANEEFKGPRSALVLLDTQLPFVRTS